MLFRSLPEMHGPRAIAAVLTGLGRDGARGLAAVAAAGGTTIAQDEAEAVAPDMPCAAADIGHAELVLPLDRIAFALTVLAGTVSAGEDSSPPSPAAAPTIPDQRPGRRPR